MIRPAPRCPRVVGAVEWRRPPHAHPFWRAELARTLTIDNRNDQKLPLRCNSCPIMVCSLERGHSKRTRHAKALARSRELIVVIAEISNKLIRIRGFHIDYVGHAQGVRSLVAPQVDRKAPPSRGSFLLHGSLAVLVIGGGSCVDVFPLAGLDAEDVKVAIVLAGDRVVPEGRLSDNPLGQFQDIPAFRDGTESIDPAADAIGGHALAENRYGRVHEARAGPAHTRSRRVR